MLLRARGAFLGAAVGDALGATVEFMDPKEIRHSFGVHKNILGGGWLGLKPGQVTDDTEMALCVGHALENAGNLDLRRIADNFVKWQQGGPVDVGATCLSGITHYLRTGSLEVPKSHLHAGNGAVMRMPGVALATFGSHELLVEWSLGQAHITHNNPLSDSACVFVGELVHGALAGEGKEELQERALKFVEDNPAFVFEPYNGKGSGFVPESLATALHALFTTDSFEECLIKTVNMGQDADTNGAIAGLLAGALYTLEGIPRRWLGRLNEGVRGEINLLTEHLLDMSPYGAGAAALPHQKPFSRGEKHP